ncbi:hypothetical protein Tco_0397873 [Tanacetum coccineum]
MIFEDYLFLTTYAVSSKEDTAYQRLDFTRKRAYSIPNMAYPTAYISQSKVNNLALSVRQLTYHETPPDQNLDEDKVRNLRSVETEFSAIVFNDKLTSEEALSCGPTVSPLNDNEIDFRILFDESDNEDYTVIYDENSFSYKIIFANNLQTDSENDNKVNMPSFPSTEPEVSYSNDLDYFKDFENEFPAIVYNDALTSKLDFLTEHTISPQHIEEFILKDETSLSECDEEEQNVLYFNDLFPFNVIYPNDLKSDTNNNNDEIDIE